ncbi:histidine phosphatase family protein [Solirubrum puertoriconensis]|uniref:Phosphoglycerate mutase n=1 Tax=Solirubrum puertoriconensis TaxID=1751427 RepID=A0A9X0HIV5_SOLP1|nr:histidine phosphatase family protein [Solirubrum puertoriconensis]KUG06656.1 phosphoglycerate mutase [Solirubrum puertoriconensis]
MKVGLVRHFKVQKELVWWQRVSAAELLQWFAEYDAAGIEEAEVNLGGVAWSRCVSSNLGRAAQTAACIFEGQVQQTPLLREVQIQPLFRSGVRLPLVLWAMLVQVAWLLNHKSQPESRQQVEQRIAAALDEALQHQENVLIVSHGAVMRFLRQELLRRGFRGPKISRRPANGELFVFEQ